MSCSVLHQLMFIVCFRLKVDEFVLKLLLGFCLFKNIGGGGAEK